MKQIDYVLLGAGGIAGYHYSSAQKIPGLGLVGVYDPSEAALKSWLQKEPGIVIERDPRKLLARAKPDLAIICSPNVAHAQLTKLAFSVGCDVLCEKPMAMSVAQCLAMEKKRKTARKQGAINFSYRYTPSFRLAKQIVGRGELGRIQRMNVRYLQSFLGAETNPYSWRNDVKIAGFGALGDLGVHMIDGVSFITGEKPFKVAGVAQTLIPWKKDVRGQRKKVTTDTNASFIIQYASGALGVFETSQVVPGYGNYFQIEISGDKGLLRVQAEETDRITLYASSTLSDFFSWATAEFPEIRVPTGFCDLQPTSCLEAFVNNLRGQKGKNDYPDFDAGISTQKCINAIHRSMKTGRWIKLA